MRNAHSRFHFVDVLTALAARAEGVDAQIFGANSDFDFVVHFRNDEDRSERSVAARGLVKGRNANEAVHAGFADQHSIGVFTGELDGGVLYAGFFAGSFVEHHRAHTFTLGPSEIHAQQYGGTVLRFGAAGAGLDGHDGVEVIAFAREQRFGFQVGDVIFGAVELAIELFQQVVALLGVGF